jgi:hypothetical protein
MSKTLELFNYVTGAKMSEISHSIRNGFELIYYIDIKQYVFMSLKTGEEWEILIKDDAVSIQP